MRDISEFIIDRILMSTLILDKTLQRDSFNESLNTLRDSIKSFLENTPLDFVSDNTVQFKKHLEGSVGEVRFSKSFAVRIRTDSVRLFMKGREVFD